MILLFKYILKIEISLLRIVFIYIVLVFLQIVLWLIKRKNIKFDGIKYSIIAGIFCWGIFMATAINLFINNPFKLFYAIISYIIFMAGGFIWGIITYSLTKNYEKKREK
ncbi:MAG: hypothetical protein LBP19_06740 [Treponema sp.]|jgi:hypothetical protein|nr:hypothetical protein [Treponema sp.]